ncbi:hypothetical protein IVB18_31030 [Bradyrhizobium sp. 186]|uniref:hypothetical protein n=1 Tax=Bradyrhizobium sp. 186 TaxID=2782654 RepID=UPI00200110DE|nr:hypothetical protein [Bradyrhizobium sp. 186]UPK32677.1 hypothetical protein IVB18_31030 [Bradyrhizobium sp. 186]
MCLLGPMPPRTPGRSDPQVPSDAGRGDSKYGRIPFVYFYREGLKADPTFGLLDIEIAIQRRGSDAFQFEIYCIGDGYQSGHGSSKPQPLAVEFRIGARTVAKADWPYPIVLNGHMDALTFSAPIAITDGDFEKIDSAFLPSVGAEATICLE